VRDQPFLKFFQVFKLLKGNLFDRASNQILSPKAAKLLGSLKFHHDLGQLSHAQKIECLKDPKIVNAE
jgi:hypothetical protein